MSLTAPEGAVANATGLLIAAPAPRNSGRRILPLSRGERSFLTRERGKLIQDCGAPFSFNSRAVSCRLPSHHQHKRGRCPPSTSSTTARTAPGQIPILFWPAPTRVPPPPGPLPCSWPRTRTGPSTNRCAPAEGEGRRERAERSAARSHPVQARPTPTRDRRGPGGHRLAGLSIAQTPAAARLTRSGQRPDG